MTDSAIAVEASRRSSPLALGATAALFLLVAWSATFVLAYDNQIVLSVGILVAVWLFSRMAPAVGDFNRKKVSRHLVQFGQGAIEGVAGPESANNAGAQTSFIPMLTLGIPSNA